MNCSDEDDPNLRRYFPWTLFLVVAIILFVFAIRTIPAHGEEASCEQVVARVGLKPLWLAEREAKAEYPNLTAAQIAWGRQCVIDHRRAVLDAWKRKIRGAF